MGTVGVKGKSVNVAKIRGMAVSHSLFGPLPLKKAIAKLGFVQADPIRSPARAQDLILRQRVAGYKAGELERKYPTLDVEEDVLYAYGFLPRESWQLLHPRDRKSLAKEEKLILQLAREHNELHPRDLEPHFGNARSINAWGGYSKVSTRLLEDLHYRGLLRIARRQEGIRIYAPASAPVQLLSPDERLKRLILLITKILSPIPLPSLKSTLRQLSYCAPGLPGRATILQQLLKSGELQTLDVEGVEYIVHPHIHTDTDAPDTVRFLAPFDPVVWDRKRFEHLWDWAYRFEAYTPVAKRKLGYYALPLLWQDKVVGWVNASVNNGKLKTEAGFVESSTKRNAKFRAAYSAELEQFAEFLGC
ncbi:MAG: winged helix DNA-binding domain-containing protein [Candidatus Obscuribacterales bacterium]|nr:winged helix DNA-binding domain-containing protein [Candidatus Obscuribacterales bacterium]